MLPDMSHRDNGLGLGSLGTRGWGHILAARRGTGPGHDADRCAPSSMQHSESELTRPQDRAPVRAHRYIARSTNSGAWINRCRPAGTTPPLGGDAPRWSPDEYVTRCLVRSHRGYFARIPVGRVQLSIYIVAVVPHDDGTQIFNRREDRGSRADHHRRLPGPHPQELSIATLRSNICAQLCDIRFRYEPGQFRSSASDVSRIRHNDDDPAPFGSLPPCQVADFRNHVACRGRTPHHSCRRCCLGPSVVAPGGVRRRACRRVVRW